MILITLLVSILGGIIFLSIKNYKYFKHPVSYNSCKDLELKFSNILISRDVQYITLTVKNISNHYVIFDSIDLKKITMGPSTDIDFYNNKYNLDFNFLPRFNNFFLNNGEEIKVTLNIGKNNFIKNKNFKKHKMIIYLPEYHSLRYEDNLITYERNNCGEIYISDFENLK